MPTVMVFLRRNLELGGAEERRTMVIDKGCIVGEHGCRTVPFPRGRFLRMRYRMADSGDINGIAIFSLRLTC
jgi:hypothetical protein